MSRLNAVRYFRPIATILLCASASLPALAQAQERTITTVFGDSGVEQGNLYAIPGNERHGAPYFVKDGFSRESNGPVWVEFLVPDITPLLGASATTPHVNYAFSGATSGSSNLATPIPSGLIEQVNVYAARRANGAPAPAARDVFVIAAGTNDFIRDLGTRDLRATSGEVVSNVTASTRRLISLGARTVIVEDVANFLAAPAFNSIVPASQRPALVAAVSAQLDVHRASQRSALRQMLTGSSADTQIAVLPLQKLLAHVQANASALGFTILNRPCYDEASGSLCSSNADVQNSYLFFDSLHLTTRGHVLQALYYGALINQLDGSANSVPGRIIADTRGLVDVAGSADRLIRDRNWLGNTVSSGLELILDGRTSRSSEGDAPGWRGGKTSLDALRFGIGYGDGQSLTMRLTGGRLDVKTHFTRGGGHDLSGWGLTASTETRIGAARFGLSLGGLWGDVRGGSRPIGVPLMQAGYRTHVSALSGEVSAAWVWSPGALLVVPAVTLRGDRVRVRGYDETGQTGLEMRFTGRSDAAFSAGAELTLAHRGWRLGAVTLQPRIKGEYRRKLDRRFTAITGELIDNVARPITALERTSAVNRPVIAPALLIGMGERVQLELSGQQTIGVRDTALAARLTFRF